MIQPSLRDYSPRFPATQHSCWAIFMPSLRDSRWFFQSGAGTLIALINHSYGTDFDESESHAEATTSACLEPLITDPGLVRLE